LEAPSAMIRDLDFDFDNSLVNVVAAKNIQEMDLAGFRIEARSVGEEFQVRRWVAAQLQAAGLVRLKEETPLDLVALQKIQWMETLQSGRRVTKLPAMFYPQLRRYLQRLRESRDGSVSGELGQALRLAQDIVNSRLNKVVRLSTAASLTDVAVRNLTEEERRLFEALNSVVSEWHEEILSSGESG